MDVLMDIDSINPLNHANPNEKKQQKMLHDINGPLINIAGFSSEIHKTLAKMNNLLRSNRDNIEPDLLEELNDLISNDLYPCIEYIDSSKQVLTERLGMYLTKP